MNNQKNSRLYNLLPSIYRQRDAVEGKVLEALLAVMESEFQIIEEDVEGLCENWFIETCDEWVVPYIGDLVGAKLLRTVENATISQRAYVANTISYRRRKGTAPILEQIAHDVTGWNARAVEFFQLLCTTQNVNHKRLENCQTPNLRNKEKLEMLNTPFDTVAHTVDVRNISTGRGCYNIPNIGVFLWRLQAYPVRKAPAFKHLEEGRYSFNQLGYDAPLFCHPITEASVTNFTEEVNVPTPIRRSDLVNNKSKYYGSERSIFLEYADGSAVGPTEIAVCDLSDWEVPSSGKIAIDPVLGRIYHPENKQVYVTYYYGFSGDIGGGFYHRTPYSLPEDSKNYLISKNSSSNNQTVYKSISEAYDKWVKDGRPNAVFEIADSDFHEIETFKMELPKKDDNKGILVIRSAPEQRPVLRVKPGSDVDKQTVEISGDEGSSLILEGLLIDKSIGLKIANDKQLDCLRINHCTMVPGENESVALDSGNYGVKLLLYRSITGKLALEKNSEAKLYLKDAIVDFKTQQGKEKDSNNYAIECYETSIEASTIFGKVNVSILNLASNTIFTEPVKVKRRQEGCVRFSYIPEDSLTPRRYRCQPICYADYSATQEGVNCPLRFSSKRYGSPDYAQLHREVSKKIFEGADNEAEMGAFNHLYQSQRINNLRSLWAEYLPFGLEIGIFIVT